MCQANKTIAVLLFCGDNVASVCVQAARPCKVVHRQEYHLTWELEISDRVSVDKGKSFVLSWAPKLALHVFLTSVSLCFKIYFTNTFSLRIISTFFQSSTVPNGFSFSI